MQTVNETEELRRWVDGWRATGEVMEEQRQRELFGMSEAEALKRSIRVLSLPKPWRRPGTAGEGMVEQQLWFMRFRRP